MSTVVLTGVRSSVDVTITGPEEALLWSGSVRASSNGTALEARLKAAEKGGASNRLWERVHP